MFWVSITAFFFFFPPSIPFFPSYPIKIWDSGGAYGQKGSIWVVNSLGVCFKKRIIEKTRKRNERRREMREEEKLKTKIFTVISAYGSRKWIRRAKRRVL
jgi:hypothetical protein